MIDEEERDSAPAASAPDPGIVFEAVSVLSSVITILGMSKEKPPLSWLLSLYHAVRRDP